MKSTEPAATTAPPRWCWPSFRPWTAPTGLAVLGLLADDCDPRLRWRPARDGKAAFAESLRDRATRREQLRDVVVMSSPAGTRAAVEYVAQGETASAAASRRDAARQRYTRPGGLFFAIREGRIERVSSYTGAAGPGAERGAAAQ